ncbi:nucleotidyltransferase [Candidatus Lokiarchaeum ossiferum]|uniref:nucleotidyltransferase n=1 Tax=Candidatus Lokiarchaeum ossiferum TaxID=2951803 RepID=UPI00352DED95
MNDEDFLHKVLRNSNPTQSQIDSMLRLRDRIRRCVNENIGGHPSMYMAGSFKKNTWIKEYHDLDMFLIWKSDFGDIKDIFYQTKDALNIEWNKVYKKKVAWRLPYSKTFHVDVVPSVQDDKNLDYSYLYNSEMDQYLRTSLNHHISEIEKYNRREVIRLLKLWKFRKSVPISTFLLEIMVHLACWNVTRSSLSLQLETCLEYIAHNICDQEYYDPANKQNIVSDNLTFKEKKEIEQKAYQALNRTYWGEIFRK